MAELPDCCFSGVADMMALDEAVALLKRRLGPVVAAESVPLTAALGRVLAADVVSPRAVPPHDNSAVDGYAVFHDDLDPDGPVRLPITGRVAAGHPLDRPAKRGEALRIFTGAPMPAGVDTVLMQENVEADGETVVIPPGAKRGANRRFAGEDVAAGTAVLQPGRRLRPQDVAMAASVGCDALRVYRPLRAAVFSTGDEVREPGAAIGEGQIFDANRYAVAGMLQDLGCTVTDLGILPDRFEAIRDALGDAAGGHDLLVTSGGVSLGEEDHVKAAVDAQGSLDFWRMAIKPGRPIALGQVKGTAFVGLPGNPVAAMVTFMRIGRLVALILAGRTDTDPVLYDVRAGFAFAKKAGRREWLRARIEPTPFGPVALKHPTDGSGILSSMVAADGLIELDEDCAGVAEGDTVAFLPFSEVLR